MNVDLIRVLRGQTGAPITACKEALDAANGNLQLALEWIRQRPELLEVPPDPSVASRQSSAPSRLSPSQQPQVTIRPERLRCPECGGSDVRTVSLTQFACESVVHFTEVVMDKRPDPAHDLGWDWFPVEVPRTRVCGHQFTDASRAPGPLALCSCGLYAIGACTDCGQPVCGKPTCSATLDGRLLCIVHGRPGLLAVEERREAEASARRISSRQMFLTRTKQQDAAEAEAQRRQREETERYEAIPVMSLGEIARWIEEKPATLEEVPPLLEPDGFGKRLRLLTSAELLMVMRATKVSAKTIRLHEGYDRHNRDKWSKTSGWVVGTYIEQAAVGYGESRLTDWTRDVAVIADGSLVRGSAFSHGEAEQ